MTSLDRMIVAQLSPAVQAFFSRLAILQILLPLLVGFSFAQPLQAQQPLSENAGFAEKVRRTDERGSHFELPCKSIWR